MIHILQMPTFSFLYNNDKNNEIDKNRKRAHKIYCACHIFGGHKQLYGICFYFYQLYEISDEMATLFNVAIFRKS